jgi:hypothetical protein
VVIQPKSPIIEQDLTQETITDFYEVKGQEHIKRAREVAVTSSHNVLLIDPPRAGKTLLARAIPVILPRMSFEEALDVTRIYSVADQLPANVPLIRNRPFRALHHTISHARWAAATGPTRARSPWLTGMCCSWMSYHSLARASWSSCASPLMTKWSPSAGASGLINQEINFSRDMPDKANAAAFMRNLPDLQFVFL